LGADDRQLAEEETGRASPTSTCSLSLTAPVRARGISNLFVAQLDDQELAVLQRALDKVTIDCTFG